MASAATQLTDKYLVDSEMHFDNFNKVSTDKALVYCIDQNTGSYTNGIVTIDTTNQLGGNNGFCSLKEGYVIVPYVVSLKNTSGSIAMASSAVANALSVSLKANVANILDRVDVSINGKPVVAGQAYSNMWNNVRLQYESASSYVQKMAGTNLLFPDDPFPTFTTSSGNSAASANGDSYCNNQINPAAALGTAGTTVPYPFNSGAFKRAFEGVNNVVAAGTGNFSLGWPSQTPAKVQQNMTNNAKSYFIPGTGSGAAGTMLGTWVYFIKLQLIDIHPIFQTLDLTKNPQVRLSLYFNTGYNTINTTTAPVFKLSTAPTIQGGNTCPVMFMSGATNNPNAGLASTSTNLDMRLAWGVCGNQDVSNTSYFPFATTRLYVPFYTLVPEIERQIIERPVQKKVYNDCYIQQFAGANGASTNGSTFTLTVQSTLPNIQYIAVLPYVNNTIAAGTTNFVSVTGVNEFASPFSSAPFTTAPGAGVYNMQVQLGSQNIYKNLMSYDYQHFLDEVSNIFAINGSDVRDIGNGMIDQIKWTNCYKTWLFDCSRQSSDVRQNVNIQGQLQSDQALDFYVIIVYRRSFDLNRITCEVTNQMN